MKILLTSSNSVQSCWGKHTWLRFQSSIYLYPLTMHTCCWSTNSTVYALLYMFDIWKKKDLLFFMDGASWRHCKVSLIPLLIDSNMCVCCFFFLVSYIPKSLWKWQKWTQIEQEFPDACELHKIHISATWIVVITAAAAICVHAICELFVCWCGCLLLPPRY